MSRTVITSCPECGNGKVFSDYKYALDAGEGKVWLLSIPCEKHLSQPVPQYFPTENGDSRA